MRGRIVTWMLAVAGSAASALAQAPLGTAFTYQGRLVDGGSPATGSYDFQLVLFDAPGGGSPVGPTLVREDVAVSDGLFTLTLDFGSSAFAGSARWLDVAVRLGASTGAFTPLAPRQPLTPSPNATFGATAPWTGVLAKPAGFADDTDNDLLGGLTCANGQIAKFNGAAWVCGADADSGGDITAVTAAAGLTGGGTAGAVSLSVDPAVVQSRVAGVCAAGSSIRTVNPDGTVVCEPDDTGVNAVTNGGGITGSIAGGTLTLGSDATVQRRLVAPTCPAGQSLQSIGPDGTPTCVLDATGADWRLGGNAGTSPATNFLGTSDGQPLELKVNGARAFRLEPATNPNLVGGAAGNSVSAGASAATIGGGFANRVTDDAGTVAGGQGNRAGNDAGLASDRPHATVSGGLNNSATNAGAVVGGGSDNTASGLNAAVPGGALNQAGGEFSLASGRRAKVRDAVQSGVPAGDRGTFVWADSTDADFTSTAPNQFLLRAGGGVGINTNAPASALHVNGTATVTGLRLPTGAISGFVLTSDASGNGSWQATAAGDITEVAAGAGLSGGGTSGNVTLSANLAALQSRVAGTCVPGSAIRVVNQDGTVACETDDNTAFTAGAGLNLTGTVFSLADLGVTTPKLADNAVTTAKIADGTIALADLGANGCSSGQVMKSNGTTWACAQDSDSGGDITAVTAGAGLAGGGTTGGVSLAVDTTAIQSRVTGVCAAGSSIRTVNAAGTVVCEPDDDSGGDITAVAASVGGGLTGGGSTGPVSLGLLTSCVDGNVLKSNGGEWFCKTDDDSGPARWSLTGNAGTNPATNFLGTTDSQPLELRVAGQRTLRLEPRLFAGVVGVNVIAGLSINTVSANATGATIAGGGTDSTTGLPAEPNRVTGIGGTIGGGSDNTATAHSTVGGGRHNVANGSSSTVAGGNTNTASGSSSTVAGGSFNIASGSSSTVAGGSSNSASGDGSMVAGGEDSTASGLLSMVPGGFFNVAGGDLSFAAGTRAHVRDRVQTGEPGTCDIAVNCGDEGTFIWADAQDAGASSLSSTGPNQFLVRAQGGLWFGTSGPVSIPGTRFIHTSTGAGLTTGGVWTNASDVALKENFEPVDGADVLARLADLPITSWNYRAEDASTRHVGPTAQDFRAAFGLGADDTSISTIDPAGLALAAIQELHRMAEEQRRLTEDLRAKVQEIAALQARLDALEAKDRR